MKYKRICARCGRETDILIENLCVDCYREIHKEETYLKKVKVCKYCGSYFYKNKKIDYEKIKDLLSEKTKVEYIVCNECKNKLNRKYNTIIQIRDLEKNEIEDIINTLNKIGYIKNIENISDNSINVYVLISKSKSLKKFLNYFKKKGFTIKISRKLKRFDRQHTKPIYELTVLLCK